MGSPEFGDRDLMPGIITDFLFEIALDVPVLALGETPYGTPDRAL
jgi:hypothetical protein